MQFPQSLKNNYFPRERGNPQPYLTPREAVFHVKGFLLILIWSFATYYKFFAIYSTFLENPEQRSLGVFFFSGIWLQCNYCNQGHLDKVDQSKLTPKAENVTGKLFFGSIILTP